MTLTVHVTDACRKGLDAWEEKKIDLLSCCDMPLVSYMIWAGKI